MRLTPKIIHSRLLKINKHKKSLNNIKNFINVIGKPIKNNLILYNNKIIPFNNNSIV